MVEIQLTCWPKDKSSAEGEFVEPGKLDVGVENRGRHDDSKEERLRL